MRRIRVVLPSVPVDIALSDQEAQVLDRVSDVVSVARQHDVVGKARDLYRAIVDTRRATRAGRSHR